MQATRVGRATAEQSLVYQSQFSVAESHWRIPGTPIQGTQANRVTHQGLCHRPSIEQTVGMQPKASRSSKLGTLEVQKNVVAQRGLGLPRPT